MRPRLATRDAPDAARRRRPSRRLQRLDPPHLPAQVGEAGSRRGGLRASCRSSTRMDLAFAQAARASSFAWVSDTHLYPRTSTRRFVEKTVRAFKEVQAMNPPADFLIFGGDLAQLGDPVELQLGAELLKEVKIKKVFIPGEHDWYLDMGATWNRMFGAVAVDLRPQGRALHRPGHDQPRAGLLDLAQVLARRSAWATWRRSTARSAAPGRRWARRQLQLPEQHARQLAEGPPVVRLHPQPAVRVLPAVELLGARLARRCTRSSSPSPTSPTSTATPTRCSTTRSARCAPSACSPPRGRGPTRPRACLRSTKPMIRADPGDHFDGVGWSRAGHGRRRHGRQRIQDVAQGGVRRGGRRFGHRATTATRC